MNLYENNLYLEDIENVSNIDLPWNKLNGRNILISGATGLVGSFLVDVLLTKAIDCTVYALGRDKEKAQMRLSKWSNDPHFVFISHDINKPLIMPEILTFDYVIHMASNTHPMLYSTDPVGTITTNIVGVQNMLEFAIKHHAERFAFASSNEIYGENRGDIELFTEDYCGYINSNTMRAGYPESKRCGEALCQAYMAQYGLDVVIPRLTRTYGPTMLMDDTKAISQFIKKGLAGENIVLKSVGTQHYSYTYVSDAVSGLLYVLLKGKSGEAYNIADERSNIMLKDLATHIARIVHRNVVFDIPDTVEAKGYSTATKALLNGNKLKNLGWRAYYDIQSGIERIISILKE